MTRPRSILLATGNSDKQRMLRWLVEGLPLDAKTPSELAVNASPDESADTHEAIARAKAEEWSLAAGMPAIASDGGLLVPALGAHWESRYTRRFAGPAADDGERQRRLLELMAPYEGVDREAAFVEGLAIADGGTTLASWEVRGATGSIIREPAAGNVIEGGDGFWVFPLWYFPEFGRTYDLLTPEERAASGDHWAGLREHLHEFAASWLA